MSVKYRDIIYDKYIYKNSKGQSYKVLSSEGSKNIVISFERTGYVRTTSIARISDGSIKDFYEPSVCNIGYLGEGIYCSLHHKKSYFKWKDMLNRCYNRHYHKRQPTYINCYVEKYWHNFQNFSDWFYSQSNWEENIELDKDIRLGYGCNVYSRESCSLVTKIENNSPRYKRSKVMGVIDKPYLFIRSDGLRSTTYNISDMARKYGLNSSHLSALVRGERKSHKSWRFKGYDSHT